MRKSPPARTGGPVQPALVEPPPRGGKWRLWLVSGIVLVALAAAAWWMLARPLRVASLSLAPSHFTETVTAPGYLTSLHRAAMGPRTAARLAALDVEVGARVEAGRALARFDDTTQIAELAAAEGALEAASAELAGAEAQRDLAARSLQSAQATAGRQRALAESDTISPAELDRAEQALAEAEAGLASAEAALRAAVAAQSASRASRDAARAGLDDLALRAPFAGQVVAHYAQPGEVVAAATPVLELADPAALAVEVRVDETALSRLVGNELARIELRALPGDYFVGQVAMIERRLDPQRRDALVLVAFDTAPPNWTLDQRADVEIATGERSDALVVPLAAIGWHRGEAFALVAEAGRAERRPVELGPATRDQVVISAGLQAGDRVLLDPSLRPGRAIELLP